MKNKLSYKIKLLSILSIFLLLLSCKSNRDKCVDSLMKEEGYDYESACEACDE